MTIDTHFWSMTILRLTNMTAKTATLGINTRWQYTAWHIHNRAVQYTRGQYTAWHIHKRAVQ